jgi:outer membrane protein TolC
VKTIIFIVYIITATVSNAQQNVFTEEAFIAVIKKHHPVAKLADIDIKIAQANITSNRSFFDPVLKFDNNRKDFDAKTYYNQRQTELAIPTWYGIDVYAGKEYIDGSKINPEKTKGSVTYLGVSVPVAQNFLIDKRRAALKQAKVFRELSEVERRIVLNDLLFEAVKAYWEWWEQYTISELLKTAASNAEARFRMVKTLHKLGDRPAIDTLEALTQVETFKIKQTENYTSLIKAQLQLSTFLWTENDVQYDLPADVVPKGFYKNETYTIEDLIRSSSSHPEVIKYQFKLKSLDIDKQLKFQSLLPKINLKYNQLGYNASETINNAWFQNNYRFGISFSMPLRLSEGRGEYQKAKLKIDQAKLEQANKQVVIYNKLKQYYTEWQQTKIQLAIQQNLTANITALQRGEETRFANGESSLFLINAREQKTIEAQQKLIELKAKSRKATISLKWAAALFG